MIRSWLCLTIWPNLVECASDLSIRMLLVQRLSAYVFTQEHPLRDQLVFKKIDGVEPSLSSEVTFHPQFINRFTHVRNAEDASYAINNRPSKSWLCSASRRGKDHLDQFCACASAGLNHL